MFRLARTFKNPAAGPNAARGFPSPGAGDQSSGDFTPPPDEAAWVSARPTQGGISWFGDSVAGNERQGFPSPENPAQRRPAGSMDAVALQYGGHLDTVTPYYSRGAAAVVPNFGKVLTNPIGAGVVAQYRPQASYGPAGQYVNGAVWWTSQAIPTSVNLQGLVDPASLEAILGPINVQAVVRTTG